MWALALAMSAVPRGAAAGEAGAPALVASVTPAAPGRQLVRASLPLAPGAVREGQALRVSDGEQELVAGLRPLTWHPQAAGEPRSVRRGLVTFPYTFRSLAPVELTLTAVAQAGERSPDLPVTVEVAGDQVRVAYRDGPTLTARLTAPPRHSAETGTAETVEQTPHYLWQRTHLPDSEWPRVIETRADALGTVTVVAHVQRNLAGDGWAPELAWEIRGALLPARLQSAGGDAEVTAAGQVHSFTDGADCSAIVAGGGLQLYHPAAPLKRRGAAAATAEPGGRLRYRYTRCRAEDGVPMQQAAWQRAEFVVSPTSQGRLTAALRSPHAVRVDWRFWDLLYRTGRPLDTGRTPVLGDLLRYHRNAVVRSMAHGDDWGNVTAYSDDRQTGDVFGMNRLNHCPPIFEEAYRSGDERLLETALLWCDNLHDQSIWWGPDGTGGTRYNNLRAMGQTPPNDDQSYMWRSNSAVNFCTKGYDAFLPAYEETGDPRLLEALEAQVRYAAEAVHADTGECRNVGDVRDFVHLYRCTGEQRYLDEALRLFRELRTKLSTGDLFSQGGAPLEPDLPFIDDDDLGYQHPFAKPYIIGYALAGLPELLEYAPDEPKLADVVRAVADFLAESQDPLGGWRYPHPRSSYLILSQGMEHAWQLVQADRAVGAAPAHLDAIERVLRQRLHGWRRTGRVFSGLTGWELATGAISDSTQLYARYQRPADRDFTRDYAEGRPEFGSAPPEGLVYFPDVLAFYLQHRPVERLLAPPAPDEPLGQMLARVSPGG